MTWNMFSGRGVCREDGQARVERPATSTIERRVYTLPYQTEALARLPFALELCEAMCLAARNSCTAQFAEDLPEKRWLLVFEAAVEPGAHVDRLNITPTEPRDGLSDDCPVRAC